MSFAVASRNLRSALVASITRLSVGARQQAALITHDSRSFLRLLGRTLSGLPADVIAASVAINLLGLALPLAILQVYDRIVPHVATATLTLLMTGIGGALVLEAMLRITRSHVIAWSAMKLAWKTNVDAARRVVTGPAELVDAQPAARWIQRLQGVATISEFNISSAPLVLIDLVFVVIFLPLLFACSRWIAAIPLTIFFLFGIAAIKRGRELRSGTTRRASAEAKIRDFLVEVLNGIVTVKALGTEQQILRRFERLSEQAAVCTYDVVRIADDAQSFGSMVFVLTQIATSTIGAVLAIKGEISIGVVACSSMLAVRVVQPLLRLVSAWNEIQSVIVAEETAKPIFELPARDPEGAHTPDRELLPARLVFDSVWFAHGDGNTRVLAGASLDVEAGEIIAITGRNHIGKSTVARLAAGQLLPESGQVLIDDVAASVASACRRGSVMVVDHRNATVRGSILNNLTLFRDTEQLGPARAAAHAIGLEEDINRLPRGYDTRLGDAATETLPTGLLQRIAIARAITSNPQLLILDEANSSLDYASDLALSNGLLSFKGKITMVLITNRPSFAAIADRRFTLVDGRFFQLEQPGMPVPAAGGSA
jgi:ATP-binding cassette, subfamily C, bacterial LapB